MHMPMVEEALKYLYSMRCKKYSNLMIHPNRYHQHSLNEPRTVRAWNGNVHNGHVWVASGHPSHESLHIAGNFRLLLIAAHWECWRRLQYRFLSAFGSGHAGCIWAFRCWAAIMIAIEQRAQRINRRGSSVENLKAARHAQTLPLSPKHKSCRIGVVSPSLSF